MKLTISIENEQYSALERYSAENKISIEEIINKATELFFCLKNKKNKGWENESEYGKMITNLLVDYQWADSKEARQELFKLGVIDENGREI